MLNFARLKRRFYHIIFWTLYVLQDALLVYTWVGPSLGKMSDSRLVWVSIEAAVVMLIPKLLITYFIMYRSIKKIVSAGSRLAVCLFEILLVLLITLVLYRVLSRYFVNPVIYQGAIKAGGLFDIRRLLMGLMDIGFVTGMAVAIKFVRLQLVAKEREKNLVREKLGAELKFLRNQTNPHFLMNTLNNIYALARKKSEDTAEVVMKLSELLRFMLYESDARFISLTDEIKMLEDYLELEKMRYNQRLKVVFTKEMDHEDYVITPLLLLPFVENAFKHGVSETRFESYIHIMLSIREGQLLFEIENSKEPGSKHTQPNSIGLNNVKRQLELVYGEHILETQNGENHYRVKLAINLNKYDSI